MTCRHPSQPIDTLARMLRKVRKTSLLRMKAVSTGDPYKTHITADVTKRTHNLQRHTTHPFPWFLEERLQLGVGVAVMFSNFAQIYCTSTCIVRYFWSLKVKAQTSHHIDS